jgi:hypothetical protein
VTVVSSILTAPFDASTGATGNSSKNTRHTNHDPLQANTQQPCWHEAMLELLLLQHPLQTTQAHTKPHRFTQEEQNRTIQSQRGPAKQLLKHSNALVVHEPVWRLLLQTNTLHCPAPLRLPAAHTLHLLVLRAAPGVSGCQCKHLISTSSHLPPAQHST